MSNVTAPDNLRFMMKYIATCTAEQLAECMPEARAAMKAELETAKAAAGTANADKIVAALTKLATVEFVKGDTPNTVELTLARDELVAALGAEAPAQAVADLRLKIAALTTAVATRDAAHQAAVATIAKLNDELAAMKMELASATTPPTVTVDGVTYMHFAGCGYVAMKLGDYNFIGTDPLTIVGLAVGPFVATPTSLVFSKTTVELTGDKYKTPVKVTTVTGDITTITTYNATGAVTGETRTRLHEYVERVIDNADSYVLSVPDTDPITIAVDTDKVIAAQTVAAKDVCNRYEAKIDGAKLRVHNGKFKWFIGNDIDYVCHVFEYKDGKLIRTLVNTAKTEMKDGHPCKYVQKKKIV